MGNLLWVCLGGAFGSGARYLVGLWVADHVGDGLPWATLLVNALGSLILAVLMVSAAPSSGGTLASPELRLALTVGVMGGFTTYSTFNQQTLRMLQEGQFGKATAYVGMTLVICLMSGAAGVALSRAMSTS